MAMSKRFKSPQFPFLPIRIRIRQREENVMALLDTGFDGDVAVPAHLLTNGDPPDGYLPWQLANGSTVLAPAFIGTVKVGSLGSYHMVIIALGDEPLVGRGLADHFTIILDHGRELIIEP